VRENLLVRHQLVVLTRPTRTLSVIARNWLFRIFRYWWRN
jgi:hypothetical protein